MLSVLMFTSEHFTAHTLLLRGVLDHISVMICPLSIPRTISFQQLKCPILCRNHETESVNSVQVRAPTCLRPGSPQQEQGAQVLISDLPRVVPQANGKA